jgi:hypothetical protein
MSNLTVLAPRIVVNLILRLSYTGAVRQSNKPRICRSLFPADILAGGGGVGDCRHQVDGDLQLN